MLKDGQMAVFFLCTIKVRYKYILHCSMIRPTLNKRHLGS